MTGFTGACGSIRVGEPANFVALGENGALLGAIIGGKLQN